MPVTRQTGRPCAALTLPEHWELMQPQALIPVQVMEGRAPGYRVIAVSKGWELLSRCD